MSGAATPPGASDEPRSGGYVRSTFKHGAVYLIGTALSRLAGFIMLPVYTRVLSPREYGVMEILAYTTDILTFLVGLGVGTAVMRYYYRFDTEQERRAVISTAAVLLFGMFILVGTPLLLLADQASLALLGPDEPSIYLRLSALILVLGVTIDVPLIVMRARQQSSAVVLAGLIRLLIAIGFNLILVVWLRMGVLGVLLSTIISGSLVGGYLMFQLLRETGIRFVPGIARQLIAFGAPFVVWELGSFVLHFSDRYFLRVFDSLETVGIYSLSYKIAMIIPFFVTGPFGNIWLPKALEIEKREGTAAIPILHAIQRHYNLLLISAAAGLTYFAPDVIRIATGPEFHSAHIPVPVLALAMVFFGFRQTAQIGAIIRDRPGLVAISTAVGATAAIVLNFALIPRFGIMGAAYATLGGFGMEFLVMRWNAMRQFPLRVEAGVLPLLIAGAVWAITTMLLPAGSPLWLSVGGHALAFLAYVGLVLVTGAATPEQRRFLFAALRDPLGSARALRGG